ncbi:MAG: hypothetical protein ACYTAF_04980 [Planctomycetota bacterium]|jgi:hypothetical protein
MNRRAAIGIVFLAAAVLAVLRCSEGTPPPPPEPPETPPIKFDGEGFLGREDLDGLGFEMTQDFLDKLEAAKKPVVERDMWDKWTHRYRLGGPLGDLEIFVRPAIDDADAEKLCVAGLKNTKATADLGLRRGNVTHAEVGLEPIIGSQSWIAEMLLTRGDGVVKVGVHRGPFYLRVLWKESARDKARLAEIREKALRATRYIAEKLP